jgi:hypothetical protein
MVKFDLSFRIKLKLPEMKSEYSECVEHIRSSASFKPIEDLKQKENECIKLLSEYESCHILHKQLNLIFKNRQKKYIEEHRIKKINV